jgi:hypothetical protein
MSDTLLKVALREGWARLDYFTGTDLVWLDGVCPSDVWAAAVAAECERCAQLLDAAHEKRKHLDNYAAFYARMIRECRLIDGATET